MTTPAPMFDFETRIIDEAAMPTMVDESIRDLLCECFPADVGYFRHQRGWNGSQPVFSVGTFHGQQLIGHVSVVWRLVRVGETPVWVGGVQNVCVSPAYRGRGVLVPMMQMAADESRRRGAAFGLLFCLSALEATYQRCGWSRISPRAVRARDSAGLVVEENAKNIAMTIDLAAQSFPEGNIDLNGPDW